MPREEVLECAEWAFENGMGTMMLQSGELNTPARMRYLDAVVRDVRKRTVALDLAKRGLEVGAGVLLTSSNQRRGHWNEGPKHGG
jgi:hypothetical protein